MLHLSSSCKYYLYRHATDMRKGIDSLCGIVTNELQLNILNGAVFIFINKNHNQIKLLLWEGDGFSMYYKRLEKGTYEMPETAINEQVVSVSNELLQHILQGVFLQSVRKRKRYQQPA